MSRLSRFFTLVELLIVIAIISILSAMLLPTLARSRSHAQGIVCTSNLKQVYGAHMYYADDHKGYFIFGKIPQANLPVGYNSISSMRYWGTFLYYTYFSRPERYTVSDYRTLKTAFLCPSFSPDDPKIFAASNKGLSWAYAMNEKLMLCKEDYYTDALNEGTNRFMNVKQASQCMLVSENRYPIRYQWEKDSVYPASDRGAYYYHNNAQNLLYVDGHTGNCRIMTTPSSNLFWTGQN